ncbi:thioredoxin family protein [Actinomadura sp. KC345]|uniref:thioredoxin family protein n=1 Tax=Actinomadura sp. KC345 TaxID=2530371 RepID=UPI001FB7D768|nr:thioredoxin family protein [Actinomadura sp. KC345]
MAIASFMVSLGTPVPSFTLPSIGGETVSDRDFAEASALLVVFMSNHCPYVRRIESAIGALTSEYAGKGLATAAVCSNDTANYPDDGADHLREQADRAGFGFPYLVDESQKTARGFNAACTPDFFLYDRERKLAYRG